MKSNSSICLFTHNPFLQRNRKLANTLAKQYTVNFPGSVRRGDSNKLLGRNIKTAIRLFKLGAESSTVHELILLDILAGFFFPSKLKDYIIDYPTPLSIELKWLGQHFLSRFMKIQENLLIKDSSAAIVPNEFMKEHLQNLGVEDVALIPNYPDSNFQATIDKESFKKTMQLPLTQKIAVFTGAGRLQEIYGLDLLLKSWKMVEQNYEDAFFVFVGPRTDSAVSKSEIINLAKNLHIKNILVTGYVSNEMLPNWINIADVCLAPRTLGFPTKWYNDKDSTKISEYAALRKPIVATGYSLSKQYLLVDQSPEAFSEGIISAFEGKVQPSEPHYWEENEVAFLNFIERFLSKHE